MHLYVELWKAKLTWLDLSAQERQGCIQSIGFKMRMLCRTLDVFAVVVFLTAGVIAQDTAPDWPQWRGPNRDGTVASFTAPRSWPERLTLGSLVDEVAQHGQLALHYLYGDTLPSDGTRGDWFRPESVVQIIPHLLKL